mmetsp:Transcript_2577/g.5143  ORF Transcript_2577/g.5143 Transcript_2577/m.5143 type:complete len:188 (+) Transcript_2577:195-758(+)
MSHAEVEARVALHQTVQSVVERLNEVGINFLAIDFDKTLVSKHTEGKKFDVGGLVPHLRPLFSELVPRAIESGICVAIVTFSPEVASIRDFLGVSFPAVADQIPIRGGDSSWQYTGAGVDRRKQPHMASAVEELTHVEGVTITRRSTLLIDDDPKNVATALNSGVKAIMMDVKDPDLTAAQMLELEA